MLCSISHTAPAIMHQLPAVCERVTPLPACVTRRGRSARPAHAGAPGAGLSAAEARAALAADERCGFGVMAPGGPAGERRVRGAGLYPTAALLNHECMPNLARFDDFDAPPGAAVAGGAGAGPSGAAAPGAAPYPGGNARIAFRALHALPAGEELTTAYFPLHLDLAERQARCREQYGFDCACPRCQAWRARWPTCPPHHCTACTQRCIGCTKAPPCAASRTAPCSAVSSQAGRRMQGLALM